MNDLKKVLSDLKPLADMVNHYRGIGADVEQWTDTTITGMFAHIVKTRPDVARALFKIVTEHMPEGESDV